MEGEDGALKIWGRKRAKGRTVVDHGYGIGLSTY